jgi:hypothetical protein
MSEPAFLLSYQKVGYRTLEGRIFFAPKVLAGAPVAALVCFTGISFPLRMLNHVFFVDFPKRFVAAGYPCGSL